MHAKTTAKAPKRDHPWATGRTLNTAPHVHRWPRRGKDEPEKGALEVWMAERREVWREEAERANDKRVTL